MDEELLPLLSRRIAELRGDTSRDSLAKATGIAKATIKNWEDGKFGKTGPGIFLLLVLAKHFNVSVDYLMGHDQGLPVGVAVIDKQAAKRIREARTLEDIEDLIRTDVQVLFGFWMPEEAQLLSPLEYGELEEELSKKVRMLHKHWAMADREVGQGGE